MLSCFYCVKKRLVYIAITALSGHQPSSYSEYTSLNIQLSCNIHSVSDVKYMFYVRCCLRSSHFNGGNTWYYVALLALLYIL